MTDELSLFAQEAPQTQPEPVPLVSEEQRQALRRAFTALGMTTARAQFDAVLDLTGQRIAHPGQLTASNAARLLHLLRARAESGVTANTGNSWADRTEDTWIDKL